MSGGSILSIVNFRYSLIACFALALFIAGALRHGEAVNTDMTSADQSAYMDYAKSLRQSNFQYVGDRNRMPVYPGLMALFYRQGMTDDEFFALGKMVGIGAAIVVLTVSFFIFLRYVHFVEAFTAIHIAAFTVFVYKSPYFQPEILFYGLTFLLFVLMIELIVHPRFAVAAAAGLVGGIAHLTKASVLPGMILCLLCLLLRMVLVSPEESVRGKLPVTEIVRHWLHLLRPFLCAGLSVTVFLLVIFPYIHTSKVRFGHYFYNVNSTFYMWYDSWDEAMAGTRAHGDRVGWPDMPPDQIPSLRKYLHDHSSLQIVARLAGGADATRKGIVKSSAYAPFGYSAFLLLYSCSVGLLMCQNRGHFLCLFRAKTTAILLFFILSYFAAYLVLYAWYAPIASGNRFFLALFLPAMFLLVWVIDHASRRGLCFSIFGRRIQASAVSPLVLIALIAYLLVVFPDQISRMRGGD
jgi:hypothetical protein